jgi:hypothetical protein
MLHFATLFDINYLSRALVLIESMRKYCSEETFFYCLVMDVETEVYFKNNPIHNLEVIPLTDLENYFPELETVKNIRNRGEYCFTLSPFYPLYILSKNPHIQQITTLDADLQFFSDVNIIFKTYPNADVLITPHNFSQANLPAIKVGKYNVSFQSFKNNANGLKVLEDWKQQCFEWCSDAFDEENQRYADQKYLDFWQERFEGVEEIRLNGAGVAPWNIEKLDLKLVNGNFYVGTEPLIFYHFQSFRIFSPFMLQHALKTFAVQKISPPMKQLYKQYFYALKKNQTESDDKIGRHKKSGGTKFSFYLNVLKSNNLFFVFGNLIFSGTPYMKIKKVFLGK